RNPQAALTRRNHVLSRMLAEGYIDAKTFDDAKAKPLGVSVASPTESIGTYFVEEIRRDLDSKLGQESLYSDGLTIETGIDLKLQRSAEAALDRGVREIAKRRAFRLPSSNVLKDGKGSLTTYTDPDWTRPIEAGAVLTGLVV